MELIKTWVNDLFIMILTISFIEILLPDSSISKYVRFIFSLIIMAVIIYPLFRLAWA